jgi:hypothetical protein
VEISIDTWVRSALEIDSAELAKLITSLPPSRRQPNAVSLAQESTLELRVMALILVSQDHSIGRYPELATLLASVGTRFCERCYAQYGSGTANRYVWGVGQFALHASQAYDRMGHRENQLAVVESALKWVNLNARDAEVYNLVDLRFARIEALIALGRLEESRKELDAEATAGNISHPLFSLLDHRIHSSLIPATKRKDGLSIEEQTADLRQQTYWLTIRSMSSIAPEFAELLNGLNMQGEFAELLNDPSMQGEVLSSSESIARESSEYEMFNRILEGAAGTVGGAANQPRLNTVIQKTSALLLADPHQGYDPIFLAQVRQTLETVRQEAIDLGLQDTAIDTLWPLYICYKRLERYVEALDLLQAIRVWVNERRALIQDPLKRAGISKRYPYLYAELSAYLIEQRDSAELLSVIEEAKGRALADRLAIEVHQEGLLINQESPANWLPELMINLGSHYLTFLADEDVTYAVCVTKEGGLHSARLSIGTKLINELRVDLDPSRWGKKTTSFYANRDDVPQQLSPLVDWLGELVDAGTLQEGDHICYSPDDLLHLVPLQYAEFRGAPFVKLVSMSRIHSATQLHHFVQKSDSRPTHYITVKVPLADEAKNNKDKVVKLGQVSDWLMSGPLPGTRLDDEKADLNSLASQNLMGAVVHFATHGYFPGPNELTSPFHGSGIVLSENGQLPQNAKSGGIFSPERIIEQGSPFKFDDSHLSLQACVSGLSEEGVGGEALIGLEWSLLIAGARSVLSTHWNIPVEGSAAFCIRFYEEWLLNGVSRAQAWRNTVLSQMDDKKPFEGDQAYRWAAFSLAGDWR